MTTTTPFKRIEHNSDDISFRTYTYENIILIPGINTQTDQKISLIDSQKMIYPEFNPSRVIVKKTRPFYSELKHRLSHAWYALKGGECD